MYYCECDDYTTSALLDTSLNPIHMCPPHSRARHPWHASANADLWGELATLVCPATTAPAVSNASVDQTYVYCAVRTLFMGISPFVSVWMCLFLRACEGIGRVRVYRSAYVRTLERHLSAPTSYHPT